MKENRAIRYLSLAAKAGRLISGADDCEKTLKAGKRGLLILASDAGGNTLRRAQRLAQENRIRLFPCQYNKSELSAAIGRGSAVSMILVTDEGLAGAFVSAHATEQEERI